MAQSLTTRSRTGSRGTISRRGEGTAPRRRFSATGSESRRRPQRDAYVALAKNPSVGGGEAVLEGPAGFYHALAGNNMGELTYSFSDEDDTTLERLTPDLGTSWMFLETLDRIYSVPGYNIAHIDVIARLWEVHDNEDVDLDREATAATLVDLTIAR